MKFKLKRIDPILMGIALLAAFLNIYGIWKDQYANAYYTAAVTSMLQSFHNFFFASFDPGGFVTVDKPPVAFWVQTLFASVLGVHGWSVILPQALAGVGSVFLIYCLVKPSFGKAAARISALVMACTPIAAAVSRSNNVDSMLVFTLLLAAWVLFKAVKKSKALLFIVAFAIIGIAFNIKMLQAYMVLPAFYLFYWLAYKVKLKKKIGVLAASTAVMLILSFSWALVVDSIPAADRPYIGSSQTNSVTELAFGYNGASRLLGQGRGGGIFQGGGNQRDGGFQRDGGNLSDYAGLRGDGNRRSGYRSDGSNQGSFTPPQGDGQNQNNNFMPFPGGGRTPSGGNQPGGRGGNFGGGGMFNTGTAGPLRLFQSSLSGQISWLLPFALLAAVGLLSGIRRKQPLSDQQKESLFWLFWLLPMMGFFSIAGFFHQYYLIMLAPAIAALTGTGWVELLRFNRQRQGWKQWLLPVGILGTTAFQLYILLPYHREIGYALPIALGVIGCLFTLYFALKFKKRTEIPANPPANQPSNFRLRIGGIAAVAGILIMLAAPLYWAATPLLYGDNAQMPAAGPQEVRGGNRLMFGQGGGQGQDNVNTQLLAYLEAHNSGEKFLFATTNAGTAETYIINSGKAVMAMGGFSGSDPILTVDKLKQMVANKEVKYFLLSGGGFGGGGSSDVQSWIKENGTEIPQSEWDSASSSTNDTRMGMGMGGAGTLYEVNP